MTFFQNLFGGGADVRGRYSKALIDSAIERAVDGTDSRLRFLTGYRKRLSEPVFTALDHTVALVDDLPPPLIASRAEYSNDMRLAAVFASAESMMADLGRDKTLRDFLAGTGCFAERVTMLLIAERVDKHILGRDLVDGMMRRDVPQVSINFVAHKVLEPAADEAESRKLLKRRAFDNLLRLALTRIGTTQVERADLEHQRDLLRSKLAALKRAGWGLRPPEGALPDQRALTAELNHITEQLHALGTDDHVLQAHLEIVAEVLQDAGHQLWSRDISLHLDAMNIERDPRDPTARRIILREFRNALGQSAIAMLLSLTPRELPPKEDFLTAAERYFR